MTKPLFSVGDTITSYLGDKPFDAVVLDKCRMGWPGRLHLLIMLPGWQTPQWWPASWCTKADNSKGKSQ